MIVYIQTDEDNRLIGFLERYIDTFDSEGNEIRIEQDVSGSIEFDLPDHLIEDGSYWDYLLIDGELVHSPDQARIEDDERMARRQEVFEELPETLSNIQDGLCEIADMAAESAVTNEDVMDAIAELGDMVAALCESMEVE